MLKAKKKPEVTVGSVPEKPKSKEPFWVYDGERRPVVVQASTEEVARLRVQESPEYDGFPVGRVYSIEKFSSICMPKGGYKTKDNPTKTVADVLEEPKDIFVLIKVVDGKIQKTRIMTSQDQAFKLADKTMDQLDSAKDDLKVFGLSGSTPVQGESIEVDLREIYSFEIRKKGETK